MLQLIKQQKASILLGHHQTPSMEKFEDRPMSLDLFYIQSLNGLDGHDGLNGQWSILSIKSMITRKQR